MILLEDNQKVTAFLPVPLKLVSFELIPRRREENLFRRFDLKANLFEQLRPPCSMVINGKTFAFRSSWNSCRHVVGLMAAIDPRTRIYERLN